MLKRQRRDVRYSTYHADAAARPLDSSEINEKKNTAALTGIQQQKCLDIVGNRGYECVRIKSFCPVPLDYESCHYSLGVVKLSCSEEGARSTPDKPLRTRGKVRGWGTEDGWWTAVEGGGNRFKSLRSA